MIWIGVALIVAGILLLAAQPLWRGELSKARLFRRHDPTDTLEPPNAGSGLEPKSNWPGLALMALGGITLLAVAATG